VDRRRFLKLAAAVALPPLLAPLAPGRADAAAPRDIHFRALRHGSAIGAHRITFKADRRRLIVETHVDITVKILFVTVFRFKHDAEEIWESGRLVSVASTTNDDGALLKVAGSAVADGFRIVGDAGPFLASATLLTSNTLWDSRILAEARLLDVQRGGEIGLVTTPLGHEQIATPWGLVRAGRHRMITPHYAGSVSYDGDGRWVKALLELRGERIEYVLAA
jgi:hypothetical protein